MMNVIAIDADAKALQTIKNYCEQIDFIQLQKTFSAADAAISYLNNFPVDLCVMEINACAASNFDLCKKISHNRKVIFTSNNREHAVEAFSLNALDYLLKPFSAERFQLAINKAKDYFKLPLDMSENFRQQYLFIRADYHLIKINFNDILYIEGLDDYMKIHLANNKIIVARLTMKSILEKLQAKNFMRVHRSFIVPLDKIENIGNHSISINSIKIPIGSTYKENFLNVMKPQALCA